MHQNSIFFIPHDAPTAGSFQGQADFMVLSNPGGTLRLLSSGDAMAQAARPMRGARTTARTAPRKTADRHWLPG
jgi:hypothetical protein